MYKHLKVFINTKLCGLVSGGGKGNAFWFLLSALVAKHFLERIEATRTKRPLKVMRRDLQLRPTTARPG